MLQVGQKLGEFEIVRLLGKGGMGEVYEAKQSSPSRSVALKVLSPKLIEDEDAVRRFWREAEVPARLDHPNIVRIISMGRSDDGTAFFTMQLVRGTSLADLIRLARDSSQPNTVAAATQIADGCAAETPTGAHISAPSPPPSSGEWPRHVLQEYLRQRYRFVAHYGAAAARALGFARAQGVLHRDIKPSNLMIDHHRQLYIVDFGLTRGLGSSALVSQPGPVRGTPWYMSPEQARGQDVDERSDIYSLGVTLYELATQGVGPFTASRESCEAVLAQVRAGQCLPLRMLAPDIPRQLEATILKAMEFRPQRRHQSAAELAEALEASQLTDSPSLVTQAISKARRQLRKRSRSVASLTILVGVVLAAIALAWFLPSVFWSTAAPAKAGGQPAGARSGGYPQTLLNRDPGIVVSLLNDQSEPVYGRRALGQGTWSVINQDLVLASPPPASSKATDVGTYLALDDDPHERWFVLDVQMRPEPAPRAADYACGVFFGLRTGQKLDGSFPRFFVIELVPSAEEKGEEDRLRIGTALIKDSKGAEAGVHEPFRHLIDKDPTVLYPLKARPWHSLKIACGPDRIQVRADDGPPREFDYSQIRRAWPNDPSINANLDPRGGIGLWVRNGKLFCKSATITEPR